jgi:hypothetical protein
VHTKKAMVDILSDLYLLVSTLGGSSKEHSECTIQHKYRLGCIFSCFEMKSSKNVFKNEEKNKENHIIIAKIITFAFYKNQNTPTERLVGNCQVRLVFILNLQILWIRF